MGKRVSGSAREETVAAAPDEGRSPGLVAGSIRWNRDGLVPAVVQDAIRGDVLMLAWMSRASATRTRCGLPAR